VRAVTPAGLAAIALVAAASGGCASSVSQRTEVLKAEARLGLRPELAVCVANAAVVELSPDELRQFIAGPGSVPAPLNEKVTRLVADCTLEVASVPTTPKASTTVPAKG